MSGDHRAPLPAVRAHDRGLGAHLRVQRADAEPRAQRAPPAPARASRQGPLGRLGRRVQPWLRARDRRLRRRQPRASSASSPSRSCSSPASPRARRASGSKLPSGFVPDEDQGYAVIGVQLPDGASLQRTHGGLQADRRHPRQGAGHPHVQRHRRLQLLHAHRRELHRHRVRRRSSRGTSARAPSMTRDRHPRQPQRAVLADPRGARLRRRAARHPGHQRDGRLQHDAPGQERRSRTSFSRRTCGRSSPRRASGPSSPACARTSRPRCRSSSRTSTRTRR